MALGESLQAAHRVLVRQAWRYCGAGFRVGHGRLLAELRILSTTVATRPPPTRHLRISSASRELSATADNQRRAVTAHSRSIVLPSDRKRECQAPSMLFEGHRLQ